MRVWCLIAISAPPTPTVHAGSQKMNIYFNTLNDDAAFLQPSYSL